MDKKIVIIGAGAAGIAAGTRLMSAGFQNVTVLEAEQRIGGRVHTVPFAEGLVELGAQWCHGEQNNAVFQLANGHDLLESSQLSVTDLQCVRSDGSALSEQQKAQLFQLMQLMEVSEEEAELPENRGKSVGAVVTERLAAALQTEAYANIDTELAGLCGQAMERYINGMLATNSWFDLSLSGYAKYRECEGNQLLAWKGHGFRKVFELLLRKFPDPAHEIPLVERIQFGKTVIGLDWSNAAEAAGKRVACSDGSMHQADHVIWTGSLGVLQKHYSTIFTPALPGRKVDAIEAHKLGTVGKIFVQFEKPFWPANFAGISTLWRAEELQEFSGTDKWVTSVSGIYPVDYQPNLLSGWISGEGASQMAQLSDEQVRAAIWRVVRIFMGGDKVPQPLAIKRSKWNVETNFLGSYSYETVRSAELAVSREDLAEPLVLAGTERPVVQFAGEATVADHFGTVHGAVDSGWREADRLIELYK